MIASRYNAQFKELKSILEPKGAKKAGKVLVSGRKIVPEMMNAALAVIAEDGAWPESLKQEKKIVWLDHALFRDLDVFGTHFPLLLCPLPEMPAWTESPPAGLELVLSLQDPANLGAVLRSAEAFGASRVVLLKECAFPFHPKSIRASSGSCFRVPLLQGPSQKDFSDAAAVGLDPHGTPLTEFAWPGDCRLLVGEEGQGLPPAFTGKKISIPMTPKLDSLNATIAASIAMFSYREQHSI